MAEHARKRSAGREAKYMEVFYIYKDHEAASHKGGIINEAIR